MKRTCPVTSNVELEPEAKIPSKDNLSNQQCVHWQGASNVSSAIGHLDI